MEQFGENLKKIRMEKGLTLEDVQKKTKIHVNILKAIEGDGLTDLSPIYLKSFIKIYCNYLGVTPEENLAAAKEQADLNAKQAKAAAAEAKARAVPEKAAPAPSRNKAPNLKKSVPNIKFTNLLIYLGILVVLLFIVAGIKGCILKHRRAALMNRETAAAQEKLKKVTVKKKQAAPKAKVVTPAPAPAPEASPAPKETKSKKEASNGIRLGIRARENCFIVLKADGKIVFQRVLGKGRFESWQAKDKIELSLGDAGAVELEVNGQLFSKIGRKKQAIKNIMITKNGMDIPS